MADMAAGDSRAGLSGSERDATLSALHREHYRWSVGDGAPTKIADNVTAASWAPWW